jgi:hypothetical protein
MSGAIFEFRNRLRDIIIPGQDSLSDLDTSRSCEVLKCSRRSSEHWELLRNHKPVGDVYLCEGHGDNNKGLLVRPVSGGYEIRDE